MEEIERALGRLFREGAEAPSGPSSSPAAGQPRWGAAPALAEGCRGALNVLWDSLAAHEVPKPRLAPVILFTGTARASGRSTLVLALALAAAERSRRAGVIDADWSRPTLSRWARIDGGDEDWVESLRANRAPEGIIIARNLRAWTLARPHPDAASPAAFRATAWRNGLERLRTSCDLVLVDAGPIAKGAASQALAGSISGAVLVARADDDAGPGGRAGAIELLRRQGIDVWGRAETFSPAAA
jgi:Mrp family chromosome partitioning ATPase